VAKISEQWSASGCWSYFMPWYSYNATTLDGHDHADTAWWTDAMQNSHVLSREDLPSLK
jgi:mannan endo-1,4-beta-mannosidase